MKEKIMDILRCQQCLGELSLINEKLVCESCGKVYPIWKKLIFMGYDKNKKNEIERIISTEREHQTNLDEIQKHYDFAYPSFELGILVINIIKQDVNKSKLITIDLASGGAPMSMILSENGFDTYRCDLDPNSLFSGLFWKHNDLDTGKHIVCDSTILPFGDNSIDIIFCKEFVHHVFDYQALFTEINRVLKKDGLFILIEPTLTIMSKFLSGKDDHFGHHYQKMSSYLSALKQIGFLPYRYYLFNFSVSKRLKIVNALRNLFHTQIYSMSLTSKFDLFLKIAIQRLIGCGNVMFLRKTKDLHSDKRLLDIKIIEPSQLILNESYLSDFRLEKFKVILNDVYQKIYRKKCRNKEIARKFHKQYSVWHGSMNRKY